MKFNDREPIYTQIVREFKRQIVRGERSPGETIPSRRELAGLWRVNANTVQRAYKEMEDCGMIETERNFQSKITTDAHTLSQFRTELIEEAVRQFGEALAAIQVDKEEAVAVVANFYERGERHA
ncbi:MAG: GntR family transcriptional regulator [Bacilli bacterium]